MTMETLGLESIDHPDDPLLLFRLKFGVKRDGEDGVGKDLAGREPLPLLKGECLLAVYWGWIMDIALDAVILQMPQEAVAVVALDHEEMVVGNTVGLFVETRDRAQPGAVVARNLAPAAVPLIQVGEFDTQYSSLNLVQPAVNAE